MTVTAEMARVAALRDLQIMDTGSEPEYDRLVRIAGHIAKASEAHMCFIDDQHQYIKALQGADLVRKVPRADSVCEAVISQGAPIVIPDLAADPLPKRRAVAEKYGLRSYVGLPIVLPEGHAVGVVAAMSETVGVCSEKRLIALQDLAQIAARELVIRRLSGFRSGVFAPAMAPKLDARAALPESHTKVLQAIGDGILGFRGDGSINFVNPAAERILGRSADTLLGLTFAEALGLPDPVQRDRMCPVAACLQDGSERFIPSTRFLKPPNGSVQVEFVISPLQSNARTTGAIIIFRDTTGVALTNGVELRKSLREVTRLKEQIAKLEAQAKTVGVSGHGFLDLDHTPNPNFAQLSAALQDEKADQLRRAHAILESWAERPRFEKVGPSSPGGVPKAIGAIPSGEEKRMLTRVERWLADQEKQGQSSARTTSFGQPIPPLGGSSRSPVRVGVLKRPV